MGTAELDFDKIFSEFHEKVRRYLERLVGKRYAEDVTQEVFLKISKGLGTFKGESSLSTWVYRVATNAALDTVKSRSYREDGRTAMLDKADDESEAGSVAVEGKGLSAEREAIRGEMNACIREFVDKLPPDYRTVIALSEIRELTNREIAEILGLSLDAVKIRLHRARARLQAEFERGCHFYHDEEGNLACDRKKKAEEPE
jgi:RNA polymerase sigma-70 factor (ECF subfamily)